MGGAWPSTTFHYTLLFVVVRCEDLDDPANGSVSLNNTSVGSLAVYMCETNFELFGGNVRICQPNGEWNSTSPTCQGDHSRVICVVLVSCLVLLLVCMLV